MGDILFLADALPSPVGRGDRVRGFHFLRHLARCRRVHLVAFADDPEDMKRKGALNTLAATRNTLWRSPPGWRLRLSAGLRGLPAAIASPEDARMRSMITAALTARRIDAIFAQSLRLARLVPEGLQQRLVVDLMEPPSSRAEAVAATARLGDHLHWRRAARLLRAEEAAAAARADALIVSHDSHAASFAGKGSSIHVVENGVDAIYYDPATVSRQLESTEAMIGLVGQNDEIADRLSGSWFMDAVLPHIRAVRPDVRVVALSSNASGALASLARRHPELRIVQRDQRPWLNAAAVLVAPWMHGGGSSSPLLEAMAMARPVVATPVAAGIVDHGGTIQVTETVGAFADRVLGLLAPGVPAAEVGRAARARVLSHYGWDFCLQPFEQLLTVPSKK